MITKIVMDKVASYNYPTFLETDKKVNLVYGLNGTGKSTLSEFLYDNKSSRFNNCSIEGLKNEDILVYNQSFINDYFYETDNLKGIFTLSKQNKEAEEVVKKAENEIDRLEKEKETNEGAKENQNNLFIEQKQMAENKTWEIKATYSGGDRVLEFCLNGLKGKKGALFSHLLGASKPDQKPTKTIYQLKKEIEDIQGNSAQKYDILSQINITPNQIETNQLFGKGIFGNEDSVVSDLIKNLGNSDWVKEGLKYIPKEIKEDATSCPFCQEKTINKILFESIKTYFDETYEKDIKELKKLIFLYVPALIHFRLKTLLNQTLLLQKRKQSLKTYIIQFTKP